MLAWFEIYIVINLVLFLQLTQLTWIIMFNILLAVSLLLVAAIVEIFVENCVHYQ